MRLDQHLTALRAWCKQCLPAWSVKAQRAPSQHCRDVRVYGHTTTAMHDMSTPPLAQNLSVSTPPLAQNLPVTLNNIS